MRRLIIISTVITFFTLSFLSVAYADECDRNCTRKCDKNCSSKCDYNCSSKRCKGKWPVIKQACIAECVGEEKACMTACKASELLCMNNCTGDEEQCRERKKKEKSEKDKKKTTYDTYLVSGSYIGCGVTIKNNSTGKIGNAGNRKRDLSNVECATVFINAFTRAGINCHGTFTPGEILIDKSSDWTADSWGPTFDKK